MNFRQANKKGFTLIEVLITVGVIAILAGVVLYALGNVRAKGRNSKREQDLTQLAAALEMYYSEHGSYPAAYPGAWSGVSTVPCGPANGTVSGANAYIQGLVPEYISVLPIDPVGTSGTCSGYLYSSDGQHYKLLAHASYEGAYPTSGQKFYDPVRPTWAIMVCSGEPACSGW